MIDVRWRSASATLDFLATVSDDARPTDASVSALLESETLSAWVRAYSRWPEFDREQLRHVLMNLLCDEPVAQTPMMRILENGFRRALTDVDLLRENLARWRAVDFRAAETKALAFLPAGAEVAARVHFTVDDFNGGFFHERDVFLSVLDIHDSFFGVDALAHEFHHIGMQSLTRHEEADREPSEAQPTIRKRLTKYLVAEGLANCYCTPQLVGLLPNVIETDDRLRRKCKQYERRFRRLFEMACEILRGSCNLAPGTGTAHSLLNGFMFDSEGVLPPGHYFSARLVQHLENSPRVSRDEIIHLCVEPDGFYALCNRDPIESDLLFPLP